MNGVSTYAFFSKRLFQDEIQVSAASAENTIKKVEIISQKDNGLEVEIKRNNSNGYRPQISFDIDGELAKYIQSVEQITVIKNGNVPLKMEIKAAALHDLKQLRTSNKGNLAGTLIVSDFNGKIITSKSINLSIDYLLNQLENVSSDTSLNRANE